MAEEKQKLTVVREGFEEPSYLSINWFQSDEKVVVDCEHCKTNNAEFNSLTGRLYCPECKTLEFLR